MSCPPRRFYVGLVIALAAAALCVTLPAGHVEGAEAHAAAAAESADAAAEEATPDAEPEEKKIQLNLKNVNLDNVIDFLRQHTGKTIVKSKNVSATITIAAPEPVTPQAAVQLIIEALRMEGVAVIERDSVIQLLPAEQLASMGVETRAVQLKYADVAQVQELLKPLLDESVKLVADPRTKKVIVTGPAEKLSQIENVMRQLDVLEIRGLQTRIFELEHAQADQVAAVLSALLSETGVRGGRPRGGPPAGDQTGVTVVAYPAANWVVVRAPTELMLAAEELVAQLDRQKPPELQLYVIPIQNADAEMLAGRLSDLFRRNRRGESVQDRVEVTADRRANALIVMCTEENYKLILDIVQKLDTEESRKTETRMLELKWADAEELAEQLNELYAGQSGSSYYPFYYYYSSRRQNQEAEVQFVAERRTNSLIVIAPPAEFEEIEALVRKLDQPLDAEEISPRIYPIKNIDAKTVTDVLSETFGVESEQQGGYYYYRRAAQETSIGRLYGKVRFVHEPSTNSVIVVTNNSKNFPIIERMIEELDRPTSEFANTMVYRLENADAGELADQLNSLFAEAGAGQRPAEDAESRFYGWLMGNRQRDEERPISNLIGKVRVVPDQRINALLITTSVQHFPVLVDLVEQLDIESPKVLIEVNLLEITRTGQQRVGTRFSPDSTIFSQDDFQNSFLGLFGVRFSDVFGDSVLSADLDLGVLIQLLQREFDANILAQPSMSVNNNREAQLFIGARVPFITRSIVEPGTAGARSDSFEYRDVGTILNVTPSINENGKVVTVVEIESSQIRPGETLFGGAILDTRNFKTELDVEDGQTIVIGGIMRDEESETVHRVPVLGHIPVLSFLFSKRDVEVLSTELIVFITPYVMSSAADADAVTEEHRRKLKSVDEWMKRNDGAGRESPE